MRGVSPVPREGVGNLPPTAARRLYPTLRPSFFPGDRKHSGKQRLHHAAESSIRRPQNPFGTAEPLRRPAEVHRQFRTGRRTADFRECGAAVLKPHPEKHPALQNYDHPAQRGGGTMSLTHFSLFSGIGGIDLAAEAAGFTSVCQCEWAAFPAAVLASHWPEVPRFQDITTVTKEAFFEKTGLRTVTLISGGFPCQPFSTAGRQRGFHDERYLWPEMLRVIRELQPRWVLGENVAGFLRMGLDKTLIDLEQAGYDVRVFVLPAAAVGAWHERKRVFIIGSAASHTPCQRHRGCGQGVGHPNLCERQLSQDEQGWQSMDGAALSCGLPHDPHHAGKALPQPGLGRVADGFPAQMDGHSLWAEEPADIPRLTEDVPNRSKRMKTLGNAVSPPQVFPILKYIADIETGRCPMGGEEL